MITINDDKDAACEGCPYPQQLTAREILVRAERLFRESITLQRRNFLTGAAAVAFVAPELANSQASIQTRTTPGQPPLVIAHRARVGRAPSNSLAGIQNAIDAGIDMVEVDVQVTRGGDHILMHDPTLSTTTNVREVFPNGAPSLEPGNSTARRYLVADYTLEDITQLRLRDRDGGEHSIPTLHAALDLAENSLLMILDQSRQYATNRFLNWPTQTMHLIPVAFIPAPLGSFQTKGVKDGGR
ncbi:glycerophosphodiester phosphodiesterase family protein [Aestuariicoccus sp. MJ-SS9]|uniref:glycerophosphodiester phosphodiesterase family protein n=1 Tax=Aestuariicoccus sp. MJ-SS9 TaxID=3079855 RepID=UPI00290D927C|nr:glycerophosphodiester phosphodiesterase family protein [Aestuariicoccus sp. MJ-SS9]MDU8914114.1 glycerophosphodiester phosphodiesterase family protein [Aestuariicoccus sp. MJ-SS9]